MHFIERCPLTIIFNIISECHPIQENLMPDAVQRIHIVLQYDISEGSLQTRNSPKLLHVSADPAPQSELRAGVQLHVRRGAS